MIIISQILSLFLIFGQIKMRPQHILPHIHELEILENRQLAISIRENLHNFFSIFKIHFSAVFWPSDTISFTCNILILHVVNSVQ
jgi:hypothetical protein